MASTFFFSDGSTITSSNTTITSSSYNNQRSTLTSANIGNEVTTIGNAAFAGCTNLTTITLPNGLQSIESSAFSGCSSLNGIIIPNNVTIIRGSAFRYCTSLSTLILGSRVSIIENFTFASCSSLITLTIPASVTSIGSVAFEACTSLTTLVISNGGNLTLSSLVFRDCTSLVNVTIGSSLKILSNGTFLRCSALNTINIPNHVTSISTQVFQDCSNLATVTIGTGVTSIGAYAFIRCASLVNINIPNSVTIINDNTFALCTSLTNVNIPDSVTTIQLFAFFGCSSLININVGASNVNLSSQDGVLFDKNKTTIQIYPPGRPGSYAIPNSVTNIQSGAFVTCGLMTSVTIPNSVITIQDNAFGDCISLTNITIPNSVIGLGYAAFLGCTNLKTVTVSSNVPDIPNDTFSNCTSLTRVNFLGNAPSEGEDGIFNNDSNDLKVYRYSIRSGWSSTFGGRTVLLIDSPIDQGLQTFGFPNISSGKILIKKQNLTSLFDNRLDSTNNIYTFKGGTINTINTVFNKNQFTADPCSAANADVLRIIKSTGTYIDYFVNSSSDRWETAIGSQDASDVVIDEGDRIILIYFIPGPKIPVTTNKIVVNGGNAGTSNVTLTRNDTSIPLCNYGGFGSFTYTFNAKWEGEVSGAVNWGTPTGDGYVVLGIATRKWLGGSGESFISFNNCMSGSTEAVAPTWVLFVYSGDEYGNSGYTYATNPSQDFNNLPTTGWVVHRDVSSVTITAFEIPISTLEITLLSAGTSSAMPPLAVGSTKIYNKQSDTEWWYGSDYYLKYDGRWYFVNEDTGSFSYHPTATNPNFIPDTGWDDGIVITSGIKISDIENIVISGGTSEGPNWHRGTYTKTSGQVIYMVDENVRFKFTPSTTMYWFGNVRGFLLIPPNCSVLCEWYEGYNTYTTTIEAICFWRLISFSNIEDNPSIVELNRNPSTNASFIPKINWSAPALPEPTSLVYPWSILTIEAGLLAATTTSITMSFENNSPSAFNGTYTRVSQGAQIISGPGQGAETQSYVLSGGAYLYRKPNFVIDQHEYENGVLCPPNSTIRSTNAYGLNTLDTPFSTWTLINLYLDNDYGWTSTVASTNPSTDPTIIPLGKWPTYLSWTNGFSLSAPSGIPEPPVGRANGDLLINFGSTGDVRNGVWYRVGSEPNIAWNNPVYGSYPLLVPPGYFYNTAQTWTFWNSDQSRPQAPSNSSTNPNFIPTIGWEESSIGRIGNLTITPINYIDVAASVSIFARPDNQWGYPGFAHFPRFATESGFAFGPYTDSIIQWNENYPPHWEIRGDNNVLEYILASPNQTTGRIPEIGTWYTPQYFRFDTLYFEGSQYS